MSDLQPVAAPANPRRVQVLRALIAIVFTLYTGRLFHLQVLRGSEFRVRAATIARRSTTLPAQRGEIYDRRWRTPLVVNVDSFSLDIVPAGLPADMRDTVFQKLAGLTGRPVEELRARIPPSILHTFQPVELVSPVPYPTIVSVAERQSDLPGVSWQVRPRRRYMETGSLSHLIGYVGAITRDELKLLFNEGYQAGDVIGKTGIERQYEDILRGRDGRKYQVVDVRGRAIPGAEPYVDPPVMGRNISLT
ncbi:MAG TPA: hypothetical protein VLH39_01710, partial [Magnetospirillaceae bacterium]|nr:hypothetical protein [Magnetospirillaceae bacterium]